MTRSKLLPKRELECRYPPPSPKSHIHRPPQALGHFRAVPRWFLRGRLPGSSPQEAPDKAETHSSLVVPFCFSVSSLGDRGGGQSWLLSLAGTRWGSGALKVHVSPQRVQINWDKFLLVLRSSSLGLIMLSFIWWCVTGTWSPVERYWESAPQVLPPRKMLGSA